MWKNFYSACNTLMIVSGSGLTALSGSVPADPVQRGEISEAESLQ